MGETARRRTRGPAPKTAHRYLPNRCVSGKTGVAATLLAGSLAARSEGPFSFS